MSMRDVPTDPTDGKPGLRLETAASVIARNFVLDHMRQFAHVIRKDRASNASVTAVYLDALAGVLALTVVGGHASRDEVLQAVGEKLREAVNRDLRHLAGL